VLGERLRCWAQYLGRTWPLAVLRSLLLRWLWESSGRLGPVWIVAWPVLLWLWQAAAVGWPKLYRWPEWRAGEWLLRQGQRLLLVAGLGLAVGRGWGGPPRALAARGMVGGPWVGLGGLLYGQEEPRVAVSRQEDGGYQATLCGHFTLQVAGDDPFRARLLMLFLRLLDVPAEQRGSRRTRDGRTPLVRQAQLATWFGLPQPDISRIEGYWLQGDWPNLLSQCTPEVLTAELLHRIVTALVSLPHQGVEQVHERLCRQGVGVTQRQVRQAAEQSGWSQLRQELQRRYHWTATTFQLRGEFLVQELLRQLQLLVECLETGQRPPAEEEVALADLR